MEFFGMENTNDHPQYNNFVANISHKSNEVKKEYFDRIIGQFVDQYLLIDGEAEAVRQHQQISQPAARVFADHGYSLCQENQEQEILSSEAIPEEEDDYILNYGLRILEVVMLLLHLKDTTKEGDGTRAAINEKMLMSFFKCHNNYSKYAIEMVTAITPKEILLSPRMAEVVKREPFVNWRGGIGNNMDDDMAIEICNSVTKRMVHGMGANKTVNAIDLASTASVGIEDITSNYDKASLIPAKSSKHTTRSSREDEINMVADLRRLRPFRKIPSRNHVSFPNISKSALSELDMDDYNRWIQKHIRQLISKI